MGPKKRGSTSKDLIPQIRLMKGKKQLCFANTDIPADYQLPAGAIVSMSHGDKVAVGDVIARIPLASGILAITSPTATLSP